MLPRGSSASGCCSAREPDAFRGRRYASEPCQERELPGVIFALLDTVIEGRDSGQVRREQLEWLDELGPRADRPVLVFGHHHAWKPGSSNRSPDYFGINPNDSERLVEVIARRPAICGYFAGHTHRNRVRKFAETGDVPYAEVACVKDFPGSWAEYRVFEGGVLQVHRRLSSPAALAWSEKCRACSGGCIPPMHSGGWRTVASRSCLASLGPDPAAAAPRGRSGAPRPQRRPKAAATPTGRPACSRACQCERTVEVLKQVTGSRGRLTTG